MDPYRRLPVIPNAHTLCRCGFFLWYAPILCTTPWVRMNSQSTDPLFDTEPRWAGLQEVLRMAGPAIVSQLSWVVMQFIDSLVADLEQGLAAAIHA